MDEQIMQNMFEFIEKDTGIKIRLSAPSKDKVDQPYTIGHRINTITVNRFIRNLQIGFDSVAFDFYIAHENAAKILDSVTKWFNQSPFNLLGEAPEVNGMNDDGDNGVYDTQLTLQIGYLAV